MRLPPQPDLRTALQGLKAMLRAGSPLAALEVFHAGLGDVFQVRLPGFSPVFLVGPEAARFVLVRARGDLRWRTESDPVTNLLRHGVLVEDGEAHDDLRRKLNPALHRRMLGGYADRILQSASEITAGWSDGDTVDMLVEMRKISLLSLTRTLFGFDLAPDLDRLWDAILAAIRYISPGIWMFWRSAPRPGYARKIKQLDEHLEQIIARRRRELEGAADAPADMLGGMIWSGMGDDLVRDQLLTMLIAGHDTVTALLAWALHLFGNHPEARQCAGAEADRAFFSGEIQAVDERLQQAEYLGWCIREALRLYPPIHLGNRRAAVDLEYGGHTIPAGTRVIYSIYLTQRDPKTWESPAQFEPERHARRDVEQPYAWLAFGGGPRNCIGAAYGQMEARLVLAHLLNGFEFEPVGSPVKMHMGATLEPHPGVFMKIRRRGSAWNPSTSVNPNRRWREAG